MGSAALGALMLGKIALLGPEGSPAVERLARAFPDAVPSVATSCNRAAIADIAVEGDTVVCTDGDIVSVWKAELGGVRLLDAMPVVDDVTRVLVAARDIRPSPPPPVRAAAVAPKLILGAGPTLFGSSDRGASLGFQLQGEIGLGRFVAVTPWIGIVPVPRHITGNPDGTAELRPTLFGCGVNFPLVGPQNLVVPRLGAGYAMLWVRTWPDQVRGAGVPNESENLIAPVLYATAALSVRVVDPIRVVLEGMLGTAASEIDVRIAGLTSASWGVPLVSAGLRAEYVLR